MWPIAKFFFYLIEGITKTQYLGNIIADSGILSTQTSVFVCEVEDIQKEYGYEGIEDIVFLTPKELETWISNKKNSQTALRSQHIVYINSIANKILYY